MKYKKDLFYIAVILLVAGLSCFFALRNILFERAISVEAGLSGNAVDLIGTKVGTTTTGVTWYRWSNGTTTYPFNINSDVDEVSLTFKALVATSTPAVSLTFLASNDESCATSSTYTAYGTSTPDIHWFDIGSHLKGTTFTQANPISVTQATTTFSWVPTLSLGTFNSYSSGKEFTLTELNYRCIAVQVNATSTTLWAQYKTKIR